jgi:DNA-binding response OmpR family regulator
MSRVLLVEDEVLISMMLEDKLRDLGHCVTGVATTVRSGLHMLSEAVPELAVVEFKLADGECHDLLRELRLRRIPVVLVTAARIDRTDPRFADMEVLAKPVDLAHLAFVLAQLQGGAAGAVDPWVRRSQPHITCDFGEG